MAASEEMRKKAITQLSAVLQKLQEFNNGDQEGAQSFAEGIVDELCSTCVCKDAFRDQLMGLLANIRSLDGELLKMGPAAAATMRPQEMLSMEQRRERNRFLRKRIREHMLHDSTKMLCSTCKLVRRDRLNVNQLALDSEENGTHFDYNFDNQCQCSTRSGSTASSSTTSTSADGNDDSGESRRSRSGEGR
uniref:Uncharacterized protein n=1 Tax=Trypanosoma congolense (strain IL3000) TaxID=1068625 RepID=G0UW58_TRYCI|nr:conserved hypothetical protein [Trypanosoma congolense IL3000]